MDDVTVHSATCSEDSLVVRGSPLSEVLLQMTTNRGADSRFVRITPASARVLVAAIQKAAGLEVPAAVVAPASAKPSVTFGTGLGETPRGRGVASRFLAVADALLRMPAWSSLPEGEGFWASIDSRLRELADEARKPAPPVFTEADFQTIVPPGYATVAGFMFKHFGAERALSDEATQVGRDLQAKRHDSSPKVRAKAPAAVTTTAPYVTEVSAYPEEVLGAHFGIVIGGGAPVGGVSVTPKARTIRGYMAVGTVTTLLRVDRFLGAQHTAGKEVRITEVDRYDSRLPYRVETLDGQDYSWVPKSTLVDTRA